jgi:hypothetical protein
MDESDDDDDIVADKLRDFIERPRVIRHQLRLQQKVLWWISGNRQFWKK